MNANTPQPKTRLEQAQQLEAAIYHRMTDYDNVSHDNPENVYYEMRCWEIASQRVDELTRIHMRETP